LPARRRPTCPARDHLTRQQVADLFSAETGERQSEDIARLVKVARRELRPAFLSADMGISGANFAVAAGGPSASSRTRERPPRALLPKIHVFLVGLEKLVETYDDVIPILQALPGAPPPSS